MIGKLKRSVGTPTRSDSWKSPTGYVRGKLFEIDRPKPTDHIEHVVEDTKPECAHIEIRSQSPVQGDEWRDDYHREVEPSDFSVPVRPGNGRQRLGVVKEFVYVSVWTWCAGCGHGIGRCRRTRNVLWSGSRVVVLDDAGGTRDYTHNGRWQREGLGKWGAASPRNLTMGFFTRIAENPGHTAQTLRRRWSL
jgi:hypothetical protein